MLPKADFIISVLNFLIFAFVKRFRISRLEYFYGLIVYLPIIMVLNYVAFNLDTLLLEYLNYTMPKVVSIAIKCLLFALIMYLSIGLITLCIRRGHDFNCHGLIIFILLLVPQINFVVLALLCLIPTSKKAQYLHEQEYRAQVEAERRRLEAYMATPEGQAEEARKNEEWWQQMADTEEQRKEQERQQREAYEQQMAYERMMRQREDEMRRNGRN